MRLECAILSVFMTLKKRVPYQDNDPITHF